MPQPRRGEDTSGHEHNVGQHIRANVFDLHVVSGLAGPLVRTLTSTGCTTATSFREGAGWYRGIGSAPVGDKNKVDSPRLRRASDREEVMDNRC